MVPTGVEFGLVMVLTLARYAILLVVPFLGEEADWQVQPKNCQNITHLHGI